jgi:hypothetical protein
MEHVIARAVPRVRALDCPNCGGTVELRGHAHTLNAVCVQCLSVLDASTPSLKVLQQFSNAQRFQPIIPLGQRGKLDGTEYEAIGFQVRQIVVEGVAYRWAEYLLYNPFKGYRYVTEYQGHWNDVRTLRSIPQYVSATKPTAIYGGKRYRHFQSASAETIYVMGEFPWQVRVGESVRVQDFVAPPDMLSSEETQGEVVWSRGVYTEPSRVWQAFSLPGKPHAPQGVFANQPSKYAGRIVSAWKTFALLALLFLACVIFIDLFNREDQVFRQRYSFASNSQGEHAFVTPVFEVHGGNVRVDINTDLNNDWAGFSLALVNEETGVAYNRAEEVSYYSGTDSDGAWTEGSRTDNTTFPAVPAGRYYMRVEPEMENDARHHAVNYDLIVTSGAVGLWWLLFAFFLLPIPAIWATIRHMSFENARWAESDYGSPFGSSTSSGGDE